jgi:hypothetical protein
MAPPPLVGRLRRLPFGFLGVLGALIGVFEDDARLRFRVVAADERFLG